MAYSRYKVDNDWRYLPLGFFTALLIWGAMIGQISWRAESLKPTYVALVDPPIQHRQIIVPELLVHRAAPQASRRQEPSAQLPRQTNAGTKQTVQTPAPSGAAIPLPGTNIPLSDKGSSESILPAAESLAPHTARADIPAKTSEGPVSLPQFGAAYLNNPKPGYPASAKKMGMEGTVMLKVLVSSRGTALKIEVVHSSGYEILDKAAAAAVKDWRFVPAHRGDTPVDEWVQVPVAFHLKK